MSQIYQFPNGELLEDDGELPIAEKVEEAKDRLQAMTDAISKEMSEEFCPTGEFVLLSQSDSGRPMTIHNTEIDNALSMMATAQEVIRKAQSYEDQ